jgi:hypothetical protein
MKRKFLALLLVLVMITSISVVGYAGDQFTATTSGFEGGSGTAEDPWQIATAEQLNNVRNYLGVDNSNKHFILVADIDLTNYNSDPYGWNPIGWWVDSNTVNAFTGSFNGNGHSIRGLYINRTQSDIGLFGITDGAVIKNVALEDVNVSGEKWVGGLVGTAIETEITGCSVTGAVTATRYSVGGLVGYLYNSLVSESSSVATVVSQSMSENYPEDEGTGGLVGNSNSSEISRSSATGTVSGERYVGGLVGYGDEAIINNSYATGAVRGADSVGGLMGYVKRAEVNKCYAIGSVVLTETTGSAGGLIGYASEILAIFDSYYNTDTTGQADINMGDPRTTDEMTYPYNAVTT